MCIFSKRNFGENVQQSSGKELNRDLTNRVKKNSVLGCLSNSVP